MTTENYFKEASGLFYFSALLTGLNVLSVTERSCGWQ